MKIHANFGGRILCYAPHAIVKSVPLEKWIAIPESKQCKRCRKAQLAMPSYSKPQPVSAHE